MKTIIGLGTAGSNIVEQMKKYETYQVFQISNEVSKTTKYKFSLPYHDDPEQYESMDFTRLQKWSQKINNDCTVFLCGASDSSAIALKFLECLHKKNIKISIVYFQPEVEVLSETKVLHERSVNGILQNYARSGLFKDICLVSNLTLESLAGPTNVYDYYTQINRVFTDTYYMLDVFKNTKPITSTFKRPKESCRIKTMAVCSLAEAEELFFPFNQEVEVVYYYGINEEKLKTEENLFRTITDKVKSKITEERKVSFGIYPTQYENDYIYAEYFSPKIQEITVDKE